MAADGFFSAGKGGGQLIDYGYKGKGVTTHLLTDGNGNPINFEVTSAKGDERQQVDSLLDGIEEFTKRQYTLQQSPRWDRRIYQAAIYVTRIDSYC